MTADGHNDLNSEDDELSSAGLHLSEDRFRDLIEHSTLGYIIIRDQKALYVNDELVRLYGYNDAQEIYDLDSTQDLFAPESRDNRRESKMMTGEANVGDMELVGLRKDGSTFWVNRRAFVIDWEGKPAICSIRRDITQQREIDQTLRKSHGEMAQLFRTTFENTPIGLALITPDGNRFMVNKALADFLGYTISELTNTTMVSTNDSETALAESMRLRQQALDGEIDTYTNTRSYRHKNGHVVWGEVTATLVRNEINDPLYFIAQTVDITDRKLAEDSLRESEQRYRILFENAAVGIGRSSVSDGRILVANEKLAEMFGYDSVTQFTEEYLLSENYVDPKFRDRFVGAFKDADVQMNDFELRRKDGSTFTFRAYDRINRDENSIDFVGIDISDLKDTEERLRESEAKYRTIFDNATAGIGRTNLYTGQVLVANKRLAHIFGYQDVDEFIREFNFQNHYPAGETREERLALYDKRPGEIIEAAFTDRDGNVIFTESEVLVDKDEGTIDFVVIDITQEHIAVRANAAKSEFLSSMSHELRTPLNAIMGFAQVLSFDRRDPLTDKQRRSVEQIIGSGEYLTSLINEVLELSKIESGKLDLSIRNIDPLPVIDEARAIATAMSEERGITVECGGAPKPLPLLRVDPIRFKQVMLNILSNAVKFNDDGGCITVSGEVRDAMFRINISDTGVGISSEDLDRLFEPFVRVGNITTGVEGTGIGLTISKQLIEAMDGAIGCTSTVGSGSTFWIDVPIADGATEGSDETQAATERHAYPTPKGPSAQTQSILYIEDNRTNVELMETVFESIPDLDLLTAATAEEGIAITRSVYPCAILMDIGLPGMDGIEATKLIKASGDISDIPVIAVSAAAMNADVRRAEEVDFYAYLTKPIDIAETLRIIRTAIS